MGYKHSNITQTKVTNAINQMCRPTKELGRSSSVFTMPEGTEYKTKDRIVKSVGEVCSKRPENTELFSNEGGKPNWRFMMEHFKKEGHLKEDQLVKIIEMASQVMEKEPNLLKVDIPCVVIGDIHGQLFDLFQLFECSGAPDKLPDHKFLFLGDYVDRGDRSIEVLTLLYALKINFPTRVFLLRGNHECKRMTEYFTYKEECQKRYSLNLYKHSITSFRSLPLAAILNEQFLCVHAGISSELISLDQINSIDRFVDTVPSRGIFCDMLWSDPINNYDSNDPKDPHFSFNSDRRCSEFYSYEAVNEFLIRNDLLCIIRGHQPQDKGYRMYKVNDETHFPSLITLFSAPNYCHTYKNKAATLIYDGELFNIKQFESNPLTPYYLPDFMNAFEWSLPFAAEKILDILTAIINITSEEELGKSLPIDAITEAFKKTEISHPIKTDSADDDFKSKKVAINRMSKLLGFWRKEVEQIDVNDDNDEELPYGKLVNGRDMLQEKVQDFSQARIGDLKNEGLPPTKEEQNKEKKIKLQNLFNI